MGTKQDIVPRVGVIVLDGDKLLAVQHKMNGREFWVPPGGGVEFGETIPECAEREVLEETGLKVKFTRFSYLNEFIAGNDQDHVINILVEAKLISGKLKLGKDPDHNSQVLKNVSWIEIKELEKIVFFPGFLKEKIKNGMKDSGNYVLEKI